MLRLPAAVRKLITFWSTGRQVSPADAREAAVQFESGHVCRNCEAQLMHLPGEDYWWCPTCGVEADKSVDDICHCGAHIGRHNAQFRCKPNANWAENLNLLTRRKVTVSLRAPEAMRPVVFRTYRTPMFEEETQE